MPADPRAVRAFEHEAARDLADVHERLAARARAVGCDATGYELLARRHRAAERAYAPLRGPSPAVEAA